MAQGTTLHASLPAKPIPMDEIRAAADKLEAFYGVRPRSDTQGDFVLLRVHPDFLAAADKLEHLFPDVRFQREVMELHCQ
jgi:hypothetical protein